jgi:hypothetical protein
MQRGPSGTPPLDGGGVRGGGCAPLQPESQDLDVAVSPTDADGLVDVQDASVVLEVHFDSYGGRVHRGGGGQRGMWQSHVLVMLRLESLLQEAHLSATLSGQEKLHSRLGHQE